MTMRITINGRHYASVEEMPAEDRALYESMQGAMAGMGDDLSQLTEDERKALIDRLRETAAGSGGSLSIQSATTRWSMNGAGHADEPKDEFFGALEQARNASTPAERQRILLGAMDGLDPGKAAKMREKLARRSGTVVSGDEAGALMRIGKTMLWMAVLAVLGYLLWRKLA